MTEMLFFMLHLFGQNCVSFCRGRFLVFEAGTEKRAAVGSEQEIPGRLACEDVLPHGTGI